MICNPKRTKYRVTFRNKFGNIKTKSATVCDSKTAHGLKAWLAYKHNHEIQQLSFGGTETKVDTQARCLMTLANSKRHLRGVNNGAFLKFGRFGLAFQNYGKLNAKLIQTLHLDVAKILKKKAKVWLRICCDTPVTSRPAETRMGKGKGAVTHYEARVYPGLVFLEFSGLGLVTFKYIHESLEKKLHKPLKMIF